VSGRTLRVNQLIDSLFFIGIYEITQICRLHLIFYSNVPFVSWMFIKEKLFDKAANIYIFFLNTVYPNKGRIVGTACTLYMYTPTPNGLHPISRHLRTDIFILTVLLHQIDAFN